MNKTVGKFVITPPSSGSGYVNLMYDGKLWQFPADELPDLVYALDCATREIERLKYIESKRTPFT